MHMQHTCARCIPLGVFDSAFLGRPRECYNQPLRVPTWRLDDRPRHYPSFLGSSDSSLGQTDGRTDGPGHSIVR